MAAAIPALQAWMKTAEASQVPVLNTALDADPAQASQQLYFVLVMLCKGQALDIVIYSGQGEGLEAWRQLIMHSI